jgi:hypothetical protein
MSHEARDAGDDRDCIGIEEQVREVDQARPPHAT